MASATCERSTGYAHSVLRLLVLVNLCVCLLSAAVVTIDVGSAAVGGVWRPHSCDDVKGGVVLTNISDGVRAVIEGCTIAVDAGSDATKSAVSIAGLGENSSVELIGCTITASFSTTLNRHGAVRVEHGGLLGSGSTVSIDNTSVSMAGQSRGAYGSALLFDVNVTSGDGFQLRVSSRSVLQATCAVSCSGLLIMGGTEDGTASTFGRRTRIEIVDSTVTVAATQTAMCVSVSQRVSFGDHSTVAVTTSNATATARSDAISVAFRNAVTFGKHSRVLLERSTVTAAAEASGAFALLLSVSAAFHDRCQVMVLSSTLTATATKRAISMTLYHSVSFTRGRVVITGSRLVSASATDSVALFLRSSLSSVRVAITESVLQFNGGSSQRSGTWRPGAVIARGDTSWNTVSLVVASSSFVAAEGSATAAVFVLWPNTITGVSPQSFDNVTFSAADAKVAPFMVAPWAALGPNATLCLHCVTAWNGAAITATPPEFTAPSARVCWSNTIDVGANAFNGEWRPHSCDDVKGGVVLTDITDGVRAVIEGCTITVDAGSDATKSAVSIAGLGENSSVELIGCTITATYNTTLVTGWSSRHGAVRIEAGATLGNGSKLLIDKTSVSVEEASRVWGASAVLLDSGITAGDGFHVRVSGGSTLRASCLEACSGFMATGRATATPSRSVFGNGTQIAIEDSVLSSGATKYAYPVLLRNSISFGPLSSFSILRTDITASVQDENAIAVYLVGNIEFGTSSHVLVRSSNATATSQISAAFCFFWNGVLFKDRCRFSISHSHLTATAETAEAYVFMARAFAFSSKGALDVSASRLRSSAMSEYGAVVLRPALSSVAITITASIFEFNGNGSPDGAIIFSEGAAFESVSLTVSSSSFISGGRTVNDDAAAVFILWPKTITGVSPQSFDNVTFSGDGVAPFAIGGGGAGPGPNATLCLRDVRWSNATAITQGPPAFTVPPPTVCWPVVTIDVGAAAVGGVWRPGSCDDVKGGVVLTNISDGIRAVIEGCTITVDAGSDATKSAVSITGLGENSSVELIGCTITATFSVSTADVFSHHGAVQVRRNSALGNGSRLLLIGTSVSMVETGAGGFGCAVLFNSGIVAGDGFQFRTTGHSTLTASCDSLCYGVYLLGETSFSRASVFGRSAQLIFENVSLSAHATESYPHALHLRSIVFGDHSSLSITECNVSAKAHAAFPRSVDLDNSTFGNGGTVSITGSKVTATAGTGNALSVVLLSTNFGKDSRVSITGSNVSAAAGTQRASSVHFSSTSFGNGGAVSITGCDLSATAGTDSVYGVFFSSAHVGNDTAVSFTKCHIAAAAGTHTACSVFFHDSSFGSGSAVSVAKCQAVAAAGTDNARAVSLFSTSFHRGSGLLIANSSLAASARTEMAYAVFDEATTIVEPPTITIRDACLVSAAPSGSAALLLQSLSSTILTVSSSVLRFNGSAAGTHTAPSGAIVANSLAVWSSVRLAVSSSSFIATDGAAAAAAPFVLWPKTITGVSPQSFDNVTFSGDGVAPFAIGGGGAGPGPNATLCLRDVRWSNGAMITRGPPEFPGDEKCRATLSATSTNTPTTTLTASASSSWSLSHRPSRTSSLSSSVVSSSVTIDPAPTNAPSPTASRVVSASPTGTKSTPLATQTQHAQVPDPRTKPPRAVPAAATDSTRALEGIGGVSGVVSPLTAGMAVRVATSARASECEQPTLDDPPAPWPLVARPLGFLDFGLSKATNPVAFEDTSLILANFALLLMSILVVTIAGTVLYFVGGAGPLPGHELREAAVASLRSGSSERAAWVAAIATAQVLGGLVVAVISVLQVPATAAAVSLLGNRALVRTGAPLAIATVTLVVCAALTAAQCALCIVGYRRWVARTADTGPSLDQDGRGADRDGSVYGDTTVAAKAEGGVPRRIVSSALDNGAGWRPSTEGPTAAIAPTAALGFAVWCHIVGDARGPLRTAASPTTSPTIIEQHHRAHQDNEAPLLALGAGASPSPPQHENRSGPSAGRTLSSLISQCAPWRRVAGTGAWWLGILEPSVSFLSGVATGMSRAGFCTVGPWAALVLQFVYVLVLVLTWPIKAPALLGTMVAVQALQLASLGSDMGMSLAGMENDAGSTVEAVADWTALVVAVGLTAVGLLAVAVRFKPYVIACYRRANRRGATADDDAAHDPWMSPPDGRWVLVPSVQSEMASLPEAALSEDVDIDGQAMPGSRAAQADDVLLHLLDGEAIDTQADNLTDVLEAQEHLYDLGDDTAVEPRADADAVSAALAHDVAELLGLATGDTAAPAALPLPEAEEERRRVGRVELTAQEIRADPFLRFTSFADGDGREGLL